jgi:PIN domain nuclease of toxin-antitoxin system
MIIMDTCALVYDALMPEKLTAAAKKAIVIAEKKNQIFCSDISLSEIAMLVEKKRLDPGTDIQTFLQLILQSRGIQIHGINMEIAILSATHSGYQHFDPADRIIMATAMHYHAALITSDKKLRTLKGLQIIW